MSDDKHDLGGNEVFTEDDDDEGHDPESPQDEDDGPWVEETINSDEFGDGVAIFDDLPLGDYHITAEHPDYHTQTDTLNLGSEGRQPILAMEPDARVRVSVTFRVEDENGAPVRNAQVSVGPEAGETNRDGEVTLDIPAGDWTLEITADGFAPHISPIIILEDEDGREETITLTEADETTFLYGRTNAPLRAWGVGYWPFDEESGFDDVLEIDGETFDGTNNGVAATDDGLAGTGGIDCGGSNTQATVDIDGIPLSDPAAPFTINIWANLNSTGSFQNFIALEYPEAGEYIGLGVWTDGELKIYSSGRTSPDGSTVPTQEWFMATVVWDGEAFHAYLNGEFDYSVTPDEHPREWLRLARRITIGTRRLGTSGEVDGLLDEAMVFDAALSDEQIEGLYDLPMQGTAPGITDPGRTNAPLDLITNADIPRNTSVSVEMREEQSDAVEMVEVDDGLRRYPLAGFVGGEANEYRPQIELTTETVRASPYVRSIAVEFDGTGERVGALFARTSGGDVLEIPVHTPGSLPDGGDWFRTRRAAGDSAGAIELTDPEASPLQCRHPVTGDVYGVVYEEL